MNKSKERHTTVYTHFGQQCFVMLMRYFFQGIATFLLVLLGISPAAANPVNCGTENAGSGSGYATSGIGNYRDDIFWLD